MKKNKKVLLYILAASVLIFGCILLVGQNKKQMLSDTSQNITGETEIDFDMLVDAHSEKESDTQSILEEESVEQTKDQSISTQESEKQTQNQSISTQESEKQKESQSILTEESVAASGKVENETMAEVENETKTELSDTVSGAVSESEDISQIPEKKYIVCIDPGHFLDEEDVMEAQNTYGYRESNVSLRLAIALKAELAKYGIDSYMTRETDHITLGGYTDKELDKGHISLRGEFAKGSDLFVSLHTNSNGIDANQVGTFEQPKEINKTIIIVNKVAYNSDIALNIANNIGAELSKVNYDSGLAFTNQFIAVTRDTAREWTSEYNDGLNQVGTVCYRWGTKGDYYGVLRGASNVGVPGIIIEHGFHSVEELRKQAMTQELVEKWAQADAYAIAKGFGR